MKLAKVLYFVAFLLAINVLTPESNNYVEANSEIINKIKKKIDNNSFIRKIKNNKDAVIFTLFATLALAFRTTFAVIHYQKNGITKKPSSDSETKPLTVPRENQNTISDNKSTSSTIKNETKSPPYNYTTTEYPPISHCSY
ncbi:early transcribed membrane protein [Plasmodium yoelii]|uniref:Early transcribed membrane protein n=2 Tax=Plasmodium yoelii TaxID=5861 RepID=A0AAE9WWF6_PLAYO|nr:early transcribed membrane protein [Plasmodium yoelii]WBY57728.1 early transcribed membrane protein [Plasmodium yoelii yoelii]CDU84849.1 early transcribed membrane protein [Plasmodium yoelii]VTZ78745.1 early transcribed membrane protein [Plasmodium yoelii]|eukprot:XP_022813232.1 early transcribed membrane protein [Plasmodium yoelii]